jgi:2,5-diamino-6-(ribosylamino)-4(3H)-pyrimidinone 5'-phosphate reductase
VRLSAEEVYKDISFPARETRPYVLINMVSSLDGKTAVGGKAGSIGSPTDRILMRALRAHADAVMIGAGTLRAEKLRLDVPEDIARARGAHGLKPQPLAVIVTESGDLPLETNLIHSSPDNLLIFVSPDTPEERIAAFSTHASVEVASEKDPVWVLEALKERHAVDVLLVEGGPTLNHALIRCGLADELFLTLAPKLFGSERPGALAILEGPALPPRRSPEPELISAHLSGNELFLRYSLRPTDFLQQ